MNLTNLIALVAFAVVTWLGARDTNQDRRTLKRLHKDPRWRGPRGGY